MDKNGIFKYIFFGYAVFYAVLTNQFWDSSADSQFTKNSWQRLLEWYLWKVAPFAALLCIINYVGCKYIFPTIVDKCIIAAKYVGVLREKRIELASGHFFKLLCFIYISYLAVTATRDEEWVPQEFMTSNSPHPGSTTMPWLLLNAKKYTHEALPLAVQQYFEFSAAYHLHVIVWHLLFSLFPSMSYNFFEMLLHHCVTMSLISFCYLTNHTAVGVLVTILHDLSDVPAYAIKLSVNTSSIVLSMSVYVVLMASWIYYRVYVFGAAVIYPLYVEEYAIRVTRNLGYNELSVYCVLLSTLLVLHCFWIALVIKMGFEFATQGVVHDSQETDPSEYSGDDSDKDN